MCVPAERLGCRDDKREQMSWDSYFLCRWEEGPECLEISAASGAECLLGEEEGDVAYISGSKSYLGLQLPEEHIALPGILVLLTGRMPCQVPQKPGAGKVVQGTFRWCMGRFWASGLCSF